MPIWCLICDHVGEETCWANWISTYGKKKKKVDCRCNVKGKAIKLLQNKKISSCFWGRKGYFKQGTKRTNHKGKRVDKLN